MRQSSSISINALGIPSAYFCNSTTKTYLMMQRLTQKYRSQTSGGPVCVIDTKHWSAAQKLMLSWDKAMDTN
jgi:hypothetical protein